MSTEERHRQAAAATNAHDVSALLGLADTYLTLYGRAGARVSANTRAAYKEGMRQLLAAWRQENLLQPSHDAGAVWVRRLEADGASPSTVRVRLAGARMLYRALRWAKATKADPFADAKAAPETTAPWDKRAPYSEQDIGRFLDCADPMERVIVLLGAHAGLRVSEMCQLCWTAIAGDSLTVINGKGGKRRVVSTSRSLRAALDHLQKALENMPNPIPGENTIPVGNTNGACPADGYIITVQSTQLALGGLNPDAVRYRIEQLAVKCGVHYRGIHALRHACGTHLLRDGASIEDAARHLGHSSTETTRIYVKWADEGLKRRLADW